MAERRATPERLAAFSDGVLAIIITIMVLELKVPHDFNAHAVEEMWPTFFSYALSYLFVGAIWVNHHHLIRHTETAEPAVIWVNLLLLFVASVIPFFTAFMAESRLDSFTTSLYAGIFCLVTLSFMLFQSVISKQFETAELKAMDRSGRRRNWIALVSYAVAVPAAYVHSGLSLAIVVGVSTMYFVPDASGKK